MNGFRPRKLRIVEPGWETFSGHFGIVEFEDGVSVGPVSWQEQQRLGALVRVTSADEGEEDTEIGPGAELIRVKALDGSDAVVQGIDKGVVVGGETRTAAANFSRAELEEIADRRGILGLREIGAPLGVVGRGIAELIEKILQAQGNSGQAVEPLAGS